ncbi:MAG TPA: tetratricopeptide repeat protein [Casimicrobiaceae bacterium]|nr:tetratricopeptide repeat protein [Casimicrobiaceae bacterium]
MGSPACSWWLRDALPSDDRHLKSRSSCDESSRVRWQFAVALIACCFSSLLFAGPAAKARTAVAQTACEAALQKWWELAQQGDAGAQHFLAMLLLHGDAAFIGKTVAASPDEALRWLRKAAYQGLASAQYDLSNEYFNGDVIPKDDSEFSEFERWFERLTRKAAEHGFALPQPDLRSLYLDSEVQRWTRKAAEQGFAPAQHNLGSRYLHGGDLGLGYESAWWFREAEGVRWLRKAAEQGWVPSQRLLASEYERGEYAPRDLIEAYKWEVIALQSTTGPTQESVKEEISRTRERIVKSMTPAQVEQASQLARDWKPTGTAIYPDARFARSEVCRVASGQIVEARAYTVRAPIGGKWMARIDSYNDSVTFSGGVTYDPPVKVTHDPTGGQGTTVMSRGSIGISVKRDELGLAGTVRDEASLVTALQCISEAESEKERVARTLVSKKIETIAGKRFYVMDYLVTSRDIPWFTHEEVAYIYLPENWKVSKRVYLFGTRQLHRIGDVLLPANTSQVSSAVSSVISGFREK